MKSRRSGTSGLRTPSFEIDGLNSLKENCAAAPRLSALIGLNDITLSTLADRSGQFTEDLLRIQFLSLTGQMNSKIQEIYRTNPKQYVRIRDNILNFKPGLMADKDLTHSLTPVEESVSGYYQSKQKRVLNIFKKYGSEKEYSLVAAELKIFDVNETFNAIRNQSYQAQYIAALSLHSLYDYVALYTAKSLLRQVGIDTSAFDIKRESSLMSLGVPTKGAPILSRYFTENVRQMVELSTHPTPIREILCRNLLRSK